MGLFDNLQKSKRNQKHNIRKETSIESKKLLQEERELQEALKAQDLQLQSIFAAEQEFENTGDIGSLISFWEDIWKGGGLLFNGSKWTFRLPDLYIKTEQYDDALKILKKIKKPEYRDKVQSYVEKINRAKERKAKRG